MDPGDEAAMAILLKNRSSSEPTDQNVRSAASIYRPLDHKRKEIRLLTVRPSSAALTGFPLGLISQPVCTLQVVSLLDNPLYDCISYCWGSPDELLEIRVNNATMQVTVNLNDALRQFRCDAQEEGLSPVRLWADAICINQNDVEEKNSQVAMMREIYSQAACVRIWLGPASAWSDDDHGYGFDMVDKIGTQGLTAPEKVKKFLVKPVLGLGKIFESPYWQRRWITQEVTVAKTLTMHFGPVNRSISIGEELENIQTFGSRMVSNYYDTVQSAIGFRPPTDPDEPPLQEWMAMNDSVQRLLAALRPITTAATLLRMGHVNELLHLLRGAKATVKHDHVYALLGMLPGEVKIEPDYDKPWEEAYAEFTQHAMQSMQNLSLLFYATYRSPGLPSWALDWSVEADEPNITPVRVQGDYFADVGTTLGLKVVSSSEIRVRGLLLDTIKELGVSTAADVSRLPTGAEVFKAGSGRDTNSVLQHWTALYAKYRRNGPGSPYSATEIDKTLFRALVGDQGDEAIKGIDYTLPRRLTSREVHRYTQQLNHFLKGRSTNRKMYDEIMSRMRKYSFFITTNGTPGMAKQNVRESDRICVFSACRVPYCLRPRQRGREIVYEVVSSCYVDGIMDGEAVLNAYAIGETITDAEVTEQDIFEDVILV